MKHRFLPRTLFIFASILTLFGIHVFRAEEEPEGDFAYDRTESILLIALSAPQGSTLDTPTATLPVDLLVDRYSWEIWRKPSGAEELRNSTTQRAAGVEVSLSGTLGVPGSQSVTTNWEGAASTTFTASGALGQPQIQASAGGASSNLSFTLPGETWTFQQTEATLSATLEAPNGDTDVPAGESRPLVLNVLYKTWDVEVSNYGNTRTANLTNSPASGAWVSWSTVSGDGYVTGGTGVESSGLAQANLVMGSANTIVRADVSYATGDATSAEHLFSVLTQPTEPTWNYVRSETIPVIVGFSADGAATVPSGQMCNLTGEVRYDVWDIYSNGSATEDRRYNYSYPAGGRTFSLTVEYGDGYLSNSTVTSDGAGRFSASYNMGATPARVRVDVDGEIPASAYVDVSPSPSGGNEPSWHFVQYDGSYSLQGPFLDGPGVNLVPGTPRVVTVNLLWNSWEVWSDGVNSTETRNLQSSPAESVAVEFSVVQGDANVGGSSSQTVTTNALGEASVVVTSGTIASQVVATVTGANLSTQTELTPSATSEANWQFDHHDGYYTLSAPTFTNPAGGQPTVTANVIRYAWEVWSDGQGNFEERNSVSGPADQVAVDFALVEGDASLGGSTQQSATTDSLGNASISVTPGLNYSVVVATIPGSGTSATGGIPPASTTEANWQFDRNEGRFTLHGPFVGGSTYELPPGSTRNVSVNVTWDSFEVWSDGLGNFEERNLVSSPAGNVGVEFVVSQGDGILTNGLQSQSILTDSEGNASVTFTMSASQSRVVASVQGATAAASVDFTPPGPTQEVWTFVRTEGTVTVSVAPVSSGAVISPGIAVPIKALAIANTWQLWESSTGATEQRNHYNGPALAVEVGLSQSGPGELNVLTTTTNADGEVFATLIPTSEPVTVVASVPFLGSVATGERVFSPQDWVFESVHHELLVSLENPWPGTLEAVVQKRSYETWIHPASSAPQIRAVSVGAAQNAQVEFATTSGIANFSSGPHGAASDGRVRIEYTAASSVTFVATAMFSGITGQAQFVAPAYSGATATVGTGSTAFVNQGPAIPFSNSSSSNLPIGSVGDFEINESSNGSDSPGGGGTEFYISIDENGIGTWLEGRALTVSHTSAVEEHIEGNGDYNLFYTFEYLGEGLGEWESDPVANDYVNVGVGMGSYERITHVISVDDGGVLVPGSPEVTIKGRFVIRWPDGAPRDMEFRVLMIDPGDNGESSVTEIAPILVGAGAYEVQGPWYDPPTDGRMDYVLLDDDGGLDEPVFHLSAGDGAGPRYRKVGLNGLPLSDDKPQAVDESGTVPEETYVDAFSRDLRHSTSDVYVDLPSSLIPLQVRRDNVQDVWNDRSGLRPAERPDRPFGLAWTTNLCGSIRMVDRLRAEVTDEQGSSQTHVISGTGWVHSREEKVDTKTQFDTLSGGLGGFVLQKRFGTTVAYEPAGIVQSFPANRIEGKGRLTEIRYFRIRSVTDRQGNRLIYEYQPNSLVPRVIYDPDRPGHRISIEQNDGRIVRVKSPGGAVTSYHYDGQYLSSVTRPDGGTTLYEYAEATEDPLSVNGPNTPPTPPDPLLHHVALGAITAPGGAKWSFDYGFNHSVRVLNEDGSRIQTGLPRLLNKTSFNGQSMATFGGARSITVRGFSIVSASTSTVVSGVGGAHQYNFSSPELFIPEQHDPSLDPDPNSSWHFTITFTGLTISGPGGTESYSFSSANGMGLSSATDIHGKTTTFGYGGDSMDNPTSETNALGQTKTYAYDFDSQVMRESTDARGVRTVYQLQPGTGLKLKEDVFNPDGSLAKTTEWKYHPFYKGFATEERVMGAGAPVSTTLFVSDSCGRVARTLVIVGGQTIETQSFYDLDGRLRGTIDGRGNRTRFDYDACGRLLRTVHPDFTESTRTYDGRGLLVSETDEAGTVTTHQYDVHSRRTQSRIDMLPSPGIDPLLHPGGEPDLITTTTYTPRGLPDVVTDARGTVTNNDYDSLGRLVTVTKGGHATTFQYGTNCGGSIFDATGFKPTLVTGPRGETTATVYDDLYRPVTVTESQRGTTHFSYDGSGNPTVVQFDNDGVIQTVTKEYDAFGRVTKETRPGDRVYRTFYTATGAVWKTIDPIGRTTLTIFDSAGRPIETQSPVLADGSRAIVRTGYDASGNPVKVTDALGKVADTIFDTRNRPVQVTAPSIVDSATGQSVRPITTTTYDGAGRVLSVTDPLGAVTRTEYDKAGRAVRVIDPLNSEVRTWYDHGGLPRFVRDARNFVTENRYDVLGRLVETIAPTENGAVASTKFQYDAAGNQTRVEDGKGGVTTFAYDHGNRVLTQTFANGDQIVNTYDARNLRTRTDAAGTVAYTYDAENRLKTVNPPGAALRTYSYDAVGRLTGVTEADNPTAAVAYTHDALDRVVSETSRGLTNTHTYDLSGHPLVTAYSSGASVARTYNDLGLIETLTDNTGRTTSWQYDKAARARALVLPNGQIQENVYDAAGRLSSRALKTAAGVILAAFAWAHDAAGNVTAQSEVWPGSPARAEGTRVTAMTYHDGGWLESEQVTEPGQPVKLTLYHYDNAANRTSKTVSENNAVSTATTYDFNAANQLVSWTERNGEGTILRSANLTFDGRGNRSGQVLVPAGGPAQTTSYAWDFQNRLVGVTDPQGGQHAYAYDYRTRRIARSEPGGTTAVSWSGGLSLAEYPVSGLQSAIPNPQSPIVEYRRGPDMGGGIGGLLHTVRDGSVKYNLGNGRGDIVAQSDATGALTWTASYEAFGRRPVETGANADRQRANTKEEDPTGLLWEHFRYRDLETGVWLSRDPAGFVDGPNLYAYVRQNPWSKFDPWGLKTKGEYQEEYDRAEKRYEELGATKTEGLSVSDGLKVGAEMYELNKAMKKAEAGIRKIEKTAKNVNQAIESLNSFQRLTGRSEIRFRVDANVLDDELADHQWVFEASNDWSNFKRDAVATVIGGVFGAARGGYRLLASRGAVAPRTTLTPSAFARGQQGSGLYPGIDRFRDITLKKGTIIYGGAPGQSAFYTTGSAIRRAGDSATDIFQGLQVAPNPVHGYRPAMTAYEVIDDIPAAFGRTLANPQNGAGGLPQIVIPNWQGSLRPIHTEILSP